MVFEHKNETINNCNLFINNDSDYEKWIDIIDYFSNNGECCFYLCGDCMDCDHIKEIIDHITYKGNNFYLFVNRCENLNKLDDIENYIPSLILNADDNIIKYLNEKKIGMLYQYLRYCDNENVGEFVVRFEINKTNINRVLESVIELTRNNIYSYIDVKTILKNPSYQNCVSEDDFYSNVENIIQMIFDKMIRDKLKIYNINDLSLMCDNLNSTYDCGCNIHNITINYDQSVSICPIIRGVFVPNMNIYEVLDENYKIKKEYKLQYEKEYKRHCEGCNCSLAMFQK